MKPYLIKQANVRILKSLLILLTILKKLAKLKWHDNERAGIMFCIECGYKNIESAKFCKQCGGNVNQETKMGRNQVYHEGDVRLPGSGMLNVTGILLIIVGGINILTIPILGDMLWAMGIAFTEFMLVVLLLSSILTITVGIFAIRGRNRAERAETLKQWGVALLISTAISFQILYSDIVYTIIGVLLSLPIMIPFFIGASRNSKSLSSNHPK